MTHTNAEVFLVQDADHAFTQDIWAWPAIEKTVSWLSSKLSASPVSAGKTTLA